jgi:hypothetical protein
LAYGLATGQNVSNIRAPASQGSCDQQAAMAVERVMLRAEEGDLVLARPFNDSFKTSLKLGSSGHFFVIGNAIAEKMRAAWPSAEFLPKEDMPDARLVQSSPQFVLAELRKTPRMGCTPDIGKCSRASRAQERDKALPSVRGMADGQDAQRLGSVTHVANIRG